jgi:phage terminase large subunit
MSEIQFSINRQPQFELLEARNMLQRDDLTKEEREYFEKLSNVDTIIDYGGRDSGKSFGGSLWAAVASADYNHRVLYSRYTMNTTDQSITKALDERIELLGYEKRFEYANNTYKTTDEDSRGRIFISGIKTSSLNQTAKLKSLEDFSIWIVDEAEEFKSFKEWKKIKRSLRAKDVQCVSVVSFNPPTIDHWLYQEFFEKAGVEPGFSGVVDNVLYIYSNYLDNIDHMAEHNVREYESKRKNYELYESTQHQQRDQLHGKIRSDFEDYKYEILGGFRLRAEGVIYPNWRYGEFDESLTYVYGLDFGFNDPDALTKVAIDRKRKILYVDEVYFKSGTSVDQLAKILERLCGYRSRIIADAADAKVIRTYWDLGFDIHKCKKGKDSVMKRIKTLQGYEIVITKNSVNLSKALNNYAWHDSKANVPKHEFSHLPDSFGYAAMDLIEQ